MIEFIEFFHNDIFVENLDQFIDRNLIKNMTATEILNYKDNSTSIVSAYLPTDGSTPRETLLRSPCVIKIPAQNIDREVLLTETNVALNKDFKSFLSEEQLKIVDNQGYVQAINSSESDSSGETYRIDPRITVWIYSKGFGGENVEGRLFDLSAFIESCQIEVSKEGGSFTLSLAPIIGVLREDDGWDIDYSRTDSYVYNGIDNYVSRSNFVKPSGNRLNNRPLFSREKFLFHQAIKSNDLVYIKFEELEMEGNKNKKKNPKDFSDYFIDGHNIESQVWDFIGLVDSNKLKCDPDSATAVISIVGRDLSKTLLEDGAYFFPLDFLSSSEEYFDTTYVRGDKPNTPINRLVSGNLYFFNAFVDRTVEYSLKFVFNMMSNVPFIKGDSLFKFYKKENISKRFDLYTQPTSAINNTSYPSDIQSKINTNNKKAVQNGEELKSVDANGVWKIIKLVFDDEIRNRRLVDSSISKSQGDLMSFCKKVCQIPFVEFWGDTYGSQFFFTARKPPFDKSSYKSNVTIDIVDSQVYEDELYFDDGEVYSWYRFIPRGNYFGNDTVSLADFPTIYFNEYMEVFGNRPLEVISNYIDYKGWISSSAGNNTDYLQAQAFQDLKFVIETNAYKPFTRKGTIILKGVRTIKVGMNIRYNSTGEIFHVTSVSNSYQITSTSIERITFITVERGMVEKNYDKYFQLIDLKENETGKSKIFAVNKEVFNYFLKGRQF
jgi:hypothetical protein